MREILFRAKRKNWRELPKEEWWVEGYPVKYQPCASKDEWTYGIVPTYASALYIIEIEPETICQYICMNDKNGNQIWENDIVKHEISDTIGTVKWYQEDYVGWCVDDIVIDEQQFTDEMWNECEVIGNVFDNPELLKGDTEWPEQISINSSTGGRKASSPGARKRNGGLSVGNKTILDPCCGSRMFWFDRNNPDVFFADNRTLETTLCDGRTLVIEPDMIIDFRDMPFEDNAFNLVVFDPPHLIHAGQNSWLAKKYGVLPTDWKPYIKAGFDECMRVLKPGHVLIMKWNEEQIKTADMLKAIGKQPLFGDRRSKTRWLCFMKEDNDNGV